MTSETLLSVCVPVYGRPQRTLRLLNQIVNQTYPGYELWMVGDCCPDFERLIQTELVQDLVAIAKSKGNIINISNLPKHYGGYGYEIRNRVRNLANGKYMIFVDNDDCIESHHFWNYVNGIYNSNYDFVYFNSWIEPTKSVRIARLESGGIGHSEIIVRTESLRRTPMQTPDYGHDWHVIDYMVRNGFRFSKCETAPTYKVMGVGDLRETGID